MLILLMYKPCSQFLRNAACHQVAVWHSRWTSSILLELVECVSLLLAERANTKQLLRFISGLIWKQATPVKPNGLSNLFTIKIDACFLICLGYTSFSYNPYILPTVFPTSHVVSYFVDTCGFGLHTSRSKHAVLVSWNKQKLHLYLHLLALIKRIDTNFQLVRNHHRKSKKILENQKVRFQTSNKTCFLSYISSIHVIFKPKPKQLRKFIKS